MFNDSTARTHAICDQHDKFDNIVEQTNYKLTKSPAIGDTKLTKYTQYVYCLQSSVYCLLTSDKPCRNRSTVSGFNCERRSSSVRPATENSLSGEVLIDGVGRTHLAHMLNLGQMSSFPRQ